METEFFALFKEYAGKYGKTIFWVFVFALLFSIGLLPLLLNIQTIWTNMEWFFNKIEITSLLLRIFTAVVILVLSFYLLRIVAYIVAFGIRLAYATPIHWRIDTTLNQVTEVLAKASELDNERFASLLLDVETIHKDWNTSKVTRLVQYIVDVNKRKGG